MALGFGIVGCGMISRFHAKALGDTRGAKLVACCSSNPKSAAKLADEFGVTAHADLKALLADPAVDAVCICTPSGAHMEPAVAAAKAGKHVLIEKPLEVTLKKCDRVIAACEQAGVQLATIFPSRFHGASQTLKKAVDGGRFGRMTMGDAYIKWHRTQEYYDSGAWRGTWALDGGGALMNQAIHTVDLLLWLMGPVEQVCAQTATLAHERIEVEDTAVATLRFASGALGVIQATTAAWPGYLKRIELHGDSGSAILEEESIRAWDFAKPRKSDAKVREAMNRGDEHGGGAGDPAAIGHHAHAKQFADFIAAIRAERSPAIDGHEGRRSVELILAIYKSAKSGKPVSLPLKSDPKLG
ncbi:Glucose--fructose oxidoreductase precursor [Pseudobythopirellula maris]|uniref:Glucose--fructose oxidoreductase n=1 Tax=Pseudobythopirellula maris TaxID=2527991 RepID=A0A5C5ZT31_9BACT|nr:Gfo/Idh/MocA family oxidoreductase [Pseudobythopirellula maris]TWT90167.1 Glucose--fructose oxidoreductase precursor [Pseudobythopirellula maris]